MIVIKILGFIPITCKIMCTLIRTWLLPWYQALKSSFPQSLLSHLLRVLPSNQNNPSCRDWGDLWRGEGWKGGRATCVCMCGRGVRKYVWMVAFFRVDLHMALSTLATFGNGYILYSLIQFMLIHSTLHHQPHRVHIQTCNITSAKRVVIRTCKQFTVDSPG